MNLIYSYNQCDLLEICIKIFSFNYLRFQKISTFKSERVSNGVNKTKYNYMTSNNFFLPKCFSVCWLNCNLDIRYFNLVEGSLWYEVFVLTVLRVYSITWNFVLDVNFEIEVVHYTVLVSTWISYIISNEVWFSVIILIFSGTLCNCSLAN
jgi:hypothetical protein